MYELIHANCIDALRDMPDKSVDCIVTDPPYGVGLDYADYEDSVENLQIIIRDALPEMRRVAQRVVLTTGLTNMFLYPRPTWVLAWLTHGTISVWGYNRWHPILVYGDDPDRNLRMRRTDTISQSPSRRDESIEHPTPKPLWFMRKLLNRVAPSPADTILDPFMGSGTTGVAAIQLGHKFIGVEVNGGYVAVAKRRIAQARPDFETTLELKAEEIMS